MSTIEVLDLGINNTRSLAHAIREASPLDVKIVSEASESSSAAALVLPGTGSFGRGVAELDNRKFRDVLLRAAGEGRFILGICLGMQLLAESSEESLGAHGLGIVKGSVKRLVPEDGWRVPHVGWNTAVAETSSASSLSGADGLDFYFSHSFQLILDAQTTDLTTPFGGGFFLSGFSQESNIFGLQFHPEKSSRNGINLLRAIFQNVA